MLKILVAKIQDERFKSKYQVWKIQDDSVTLKLELGDFRRNETSFS